MSARHKQELQIIQAFSSVDVPEKIIRDSNIRELLRDMTDGQTAVKSSAQRLEKLRQAQKDGNFIGNWWNNRDDLVQDAQIDLNKSIGHLTQKSSQLLIVNTAISKVLNDQQRILLDQQKTLKLQADTLAEQNHKILEQQTRLEEQQQEINAANQGLLEAKGISQEQARKLVGCVQKITEAEKNNQAANQELRVALEQHVNDSVAQCIASLNSGFAEQTERHTELEQQLTHAFSAQSQHIQAELDRFANEAATFNATIETQLKAQSQTTLDQLSAQDAATQQLSEAVSQQFKTVQHDTTTAMDQQRLALLEQLQGLADKQDAAQKEQARELMAQKESMLLSMQNLQSNLDTATDTLKSTEVDLDLLQAAHLKSTSRNRWALSLLTCLIAASIGWQIAQHYSLL